MEWNGVKESRVGSGRERERLRERRKQTGESAREREREKILLRERQQNNWVRRRKQKTHKHIHTTPFWRDRKTAERERVGIHYARGKIEREEENLFLLL